MKAIIQCAASKTPGAGCLRTQAGQQVKFIARPRPSDDHWFYARPDDPSDLPGQTWREQLLNYNSVESDNPLGLLEAYRLYQPPSDPTIYRELVDHLSIDNVFILSAGWGLVRASYLLPDYDITFSMQAESYKRRRPGDQFMDWCHIGNDVDEPVFFFGGKDYLPLLQRLTDRLPAEKVVYYATSYTPLLPARGWRAVRAFERGYTNWQYACAREFLAGRLPR